MRFTEPLVPGTLVLREKRFLAHVRLADGQQVIAHTNNTGAMRGCSTPGSRVWLSPAANPKRKLKWTWEIIEIADSPASPQPVMAGINTLLPNKLVHEAVLAERIPSLRGYDDVRTEVKYGTEKSRIDLLLERGEDRCWVEVKNVTLVDADGGGAFPDSVTERGRKHLRELAEMARAGDRAVLLWTVQRSDIASVRPADEIDPKYGEELRRAVKAGLEVMAWRATVGIDGIELTEELPVVL
ncbi:MAG: DNA/RNA nuclease SfsA [Deltaproteobacteria bacterium]|nr:DNA/RNA nuclease SfsA [Deltaproteobacteria bacterium]